MTREEKRALLLDCVRHYDGEWVSADAVQTAYISHLSGGRWRLPEHAQGDYISIIGVGRMLSAMVAEGLLEKTSNGYMGLYRPNPKA